MVPNTRPGKIRDMSNIAKINLLISYDNVELHGFVKIAIGQGIFGMITITLVKQPCPLSYKRTHFF